MQKGTKFPVAVSWGSTDRENFDVFSLFMVPDPKFPLRKKSDLYIYVRNFFIQQDPKIILKNCFMKLLIGEEKAFSQKKKNNN